MPAAGPRSTSTSPDELRSAPHAAAAGHDAWARMPATTRTRIPHGEPDDGGVARVPTTGCLTAKTILFGRWAQKQPRSPRTSTAERRRGARLPPCTYTRHMVPPPCRGPAALALRTVSRPSLARVHGREVAGVCVIRVFPVLFFGAAGAKVAAVAANQHRRAKARREAAPMHACTFCGAAAVPWAGRVGPKGRFSAVPSAGP
jgi:hypothetical protein